MRGIGEEKIIKNRAELLSRGEPGLRRDLLEIIEAGIRGGDPGTGTRRELRRSGTDLWVGEHRYDLRQVDRIYVVGVGKGSFPIVQALEDILDERIAEGVAVVKKGEKRLLRRIAVHEAAHPIPDESSVEGAKKVLEIAHKAGEKDLVFAAITGGSSALATLPPEGIALKEIQDLNDLLLKSGAVIREMNVVRKHLCKIKGGRFVSHIQPAEAVTLFLNTAPEGMPWPDLCLADPSTFQEAIAILKRYDLWEAVSGSIRRYLTEGQNRPELETVKSLDGMKTRMVSVGDPPSMCRAAAQRAKELGYRDVILSTQMEGEAREVGICHAGITKEIIKHHRPFEPPCALISGGETTVTIHGACGRGGPNQEFVLGFADKFRSSERFACASVDSDGTDGPTSIAGGLIDHIVLGEARKSGFNFADYLKTHNSSEALAQLGGVIQTGHTGTNLQNLRVVLVP
jgi:glycerate 2-kinase